MQVMRETLVLLVLLMGLETVGTGVLKSQML